eukprot:COSAG01_NODE_37602_length_501_cov_1.022388_1_plen_85_part_10
MTWVYGTLPKGGRTTWTWRKFGVAEYFNLFKKADTPRQRGGEEDPTLTLSFTVKARRKEEPTPDRAPRVTAGVGNSGGSTASGGG